MGQLLNASNAIKSFTSPVILGNLIVYFARSEILTLFVINRTNYFLGFLKKTFEGIL